MQKKENETSKVCCICKIDKPLDCYHRQSKGVLGRQSRCKDCHKIAQRNYTSRKPEKIWVLNLRRMGLTIEEYEQMSNQQGNKCAACGSVEISIDGKTKKVRRLAIDHDHNCCPNKRACKDCIRGLLCQSCNQALGMLNDDLTRVLMLADYIQKNPRFWS